MNELRFLEKSVKNEREKDFERNEKILGELLDNEITGVAKGQTEQIANSLKSDIQLKIAIDILKHKKQYNKFLNIKN